MICEDIKLIKKYILFIFIKRIKYKMISYVCAFFTILSMLSFSLLLLHLQIF